MEKTKLLIATTNKGKFKEIEYFLHDLPFKFLSLDDLPKKIKAPEENAKTLEENAILKAKYYGKKFNLISLADDGGLFVDALNGWPGIKSARVGDTDENRRKILLKKMSKIKKEKRTAIFKTVLSIYDPFTDSSFSVSGELNGIILKKPAKNLNINFGYNPLFYVQEIKKTYGEMTLNEKNSCSHRGKALSKIKYYLQNQYGSKHIVVPFALIIKNDKLLMTKRNDPNRPEYHNKWEFPGGGVEFGETMEENLLREVREEVGYNVEIIKMLQYIAVESQQYPTFKYQVFLVPYVCKIKNGNGNFSSSESLGIEWFDLDDVLNHNLIGENARMYKKFLPELKEIVKR